MTSVLPFITPDLPGTGGRLRAEPGDFRVDEVPAYVASGSGDHVLCRIEKRGLTTFEAVAALARAVGVAPADAGTAGLKDKHAVTTQYVSLPPPVSPDAVLALELDRIRVLSAERHPNKLKTGHLRGNRFRLRVRGVDADAQSRARAILDALARPPGAPNWYGEQRFGRGGETSELGRQLVTGGGSKRLPGRKRRLAVSAFQSLLFNEYLTERIERGLFAEVVDGDLAQIRGHVRCFDVVDVNAERLRFDRGEIVTTGPMLGHRMRAPAEGTMAAALEGEIFDRHGVTADSFRPLGKLAPGTRRPLAVALDDARAHGDGDVLIIEFGLPAGAYATAVMREILKTDDAPDGEPNLGAGS